MERLCFTLIRSDSLTMDSTDLVFDDIDIGLEQEDQSNELCNNPEVEYPCIKISNVLLTSTLDILQSISKNSLRRFDTYVDVDGSIIKSGKTTLSFEAIQFMRRCSIELTIYADKDTAQPVDLSDPECVVKYI